MILPVDFGELSILLAITSIILLITSELIPLYYRKILISRKKLRRAAIVFSVFFLITVTIRILNIIASI
jgi:hypothetical protein